MRVADAAMYATWAMLAVYCALYFPVAIALIRKLDRGTRLPLIVSVPVVWVGLEFIRSFLLSGFAWYYLGHRQPYFLLFIQSADLGGVYVVSFLIAAVNAYLFELLYAQHGFRELFGLSSERAPSEPRSLVTQVVVVALLLAANLGYGFCRLG